MRILGVDPGSWRTGAGVIEIQGSQCRLVHVEVVTIKNALAVPQRLRRIYEALGAAAMLAASKRDIPVVEYPPARVKQSISGNGRASKEQMQHMVKNLLKLQSAPPSDGADALAVAICHAHATKAEQAITEAQKKLQAILGKKRKRKRNVLLSYRKSG